MSTDSWLIKCIAGSCEIPPSLLKYQPTVYRDGRHVTYMYDVSHDARVQLNLYDHPLRHN